MQWWRQYLPHSMQSAAASASAGAGPYAAASAAALAAIDAMAVLHAPSRALDTSAGGSWSVRRVDPLWIEHPAAVLGADAPLDEFTLPTSFSLAAGFGFRTAPVLHIAPDAFSKDHARASSAADVGSYAIWLEVRVRRTPLARTPFGSLRIPSDRFGSLRIASDSFGLPSDLTRSLPIPPDPSRRRTRP